MAKHLEVSLNRRISRPVRPPDCDGLLTQGIGLRPHPWAGFSRPVGPVPEGVKVSRGPGARHFVGPAPCLWGLDHLRTGERCQRCRHPIHESRVATS